jgi:hypothetical protein
MLPLRILLLQFSLCYSQGKDGSLVVAPYPGSITEPYPVESSTIPLVPLESRLQTFYTKDSFEKVMAHYTKSLGAFEPLPEDNTGYYHAVIDFREVEAYLSKRGIQMGEAAPPFTRGERAGVTIYGKPTNANLTVGEAIDKLQHAYMLRFNALEAESVTDITKHIEDAELKQAVARYEHVSWEHFPLTKEKQMDEVIFEKYFVAPEEARKKEGQELAKTMQELSAQRKYEEAGKIGDRMMELTHRENDPHRNWDNAIKCLQEMEKNAYATKIVIDRPPSRWDLSGYKK